MDARFSPDWVAELDRRLSALDVPEVPDAVVVEHTVIGDAETTWHVRLGPDGARAATGPASPTATPVVRLRSSEATATALRTGELAPRTAFMQGLLQVGGDTEALVAARPALAAVAAAIAVAHPAAGGPHRADDGDG